MWKTTQERSSRSPEEKPNLGNISRRKRKEGKKRNVGNVMNQKEDCGDPCCESAGEKQTKQSDRQREMLLAGTSQEVWG